MRALFLVLALAVLADQSAAGDAVTVLQERRTRLPGKKPVVEHVALVKNVSSQRVRALRVTVELHDTFGKLLWTRTVAPGPSTLKPGETASLSVAAPELADYKKTVYRFEYRVDEKARAAPAR
jgi:hypothetical protein